MSDGIIGFFTRHNLECKPLDGQSWTMAGKIQLADPDNPNLDATSDESGGVYESAQHCEEDLISILERYERIEGAPEPVTISPIEEPGRPERATTRARKEEPAALVQKSAPDLVPEPTPAERAQTDRPDNNLPEALRQTPAPEPPAPTPPERATQTVPGGNPFESAVQRLEQQITGFFDNGQRAAGQLKEQLETAVGDGEMNWVLGATGASALDTLSAAMELAKGMPLGILDTRHLGEGIRQGTFEGVKQDAQRILNIVPQGRILKLVDRGLTATDVVEEASSGNLSGALFAAGFGVLSAAGHAKNQRVDTRIDPKKTQAYKSLVDRHKLEAKQAPSGSGKWGKHERNNTFGKRDEHYVGNIDNGRGLKIKTVQIDGLWATVGKKLVLVESKWGDPKTPIDYSRHWKSVDDKVDQLQRYLRFMKENPDEISHMQLVVSVQQVGEIFVNVIMQKLPASALTKIDFVLRK